MSCHAVRVRRIQYHAWLRTWTIARLGGRDVLDALPLVRGRLLAPVWRGGIRRAKSQLQCECGVQSTWGWCHAHAFDTLGSAAPPCNAPAQLSCARAQRVCLKHTCGLDTVTATPGFGASAPAPGTAFLSSLAPAQLPLESPVARLSHGWVGHWWACLHRGLQSSR